MVVGSRRFFSVATHGLTEAAGGSDTNSDACAARGHPPNNELGLEPPLPEDLGAAIPH